MPPYGFRVVGGRHGDRRLIDYARAFHAYCGLECDTNHEAYLSAFRYGDDFRALDSGRKVLTKGFAGDCWSDWLWFDIDNEELSQSHQDCQRLVSLLLERYSLDDDELLLFFSGSKGYHVGLATGLWTPEPSTEFNSRCKAMAVRLAELAGVTIDRIYDRVRLFRAPNSRHQKTGLYKRRIELETLIRLTASGVAELARQPMAFELPEPPAINETAVADWQAAIARTSEVTELRQSSKANASLNRQTKEIIKGDFLPANGDRHRLLFSAAANLAELGCPLSLAHELLSETGLNSGLPPSEVARQIDCGWKHGGR
ncbi:MAG: hypothetical protein KDA87_18765 [Planctomycetales bacterium]|nr:hypothetical protein [Planctomycetales bacterium]